MACSGLTPAIAVRVMDGIERLYRKNPYPRDYANPSFDTPDYDEGLGLTGLHKVRQKVSLEPRATILPPDLFRQYAKSSFWYNTAGSRCNVLMVRP